MWTASSERRDGVQRIILLLTDGRPTLPLIDPWAAAQITIEQAKRAAQVGIRIDTYAISAHAEPTVLVEVARVANGIFTPFLARGTPQRLRVSSIKIENLTVARQAAIVHTVAEGAFHALVPVRAGPNRVEVVAHSETGARIGHVFEWKFATPGPQDEMPGELRAKRKLLLTELRGRETPPPAGAPAPR